MYQTRANQKDAAQDAERRVFAKIGWRLMPLLIVAYILNYLDRNNVGLRRVDDEPGDRADGDAVRLAGGILFFSATASSRFRATSRSTASARGSGCRGS